MPWDCFGIFKTQTKNKGISLVVAEENKPYELFRDPTDPYYKEALAITFSYIVPLAGQDADGYHYMTEDKSSSWVIYHNVSSNKVAYGFHLLHDQPKNIRVNFTESDTRKIHEAIRAKVSPAAAP